MVPAGLSAQVAETAGNLFEEYIIDDADHNDPAMLGPEVADAVARIATMRP